MDVGILLILLVVSMIGSVFGADQKDVEGLRSDQSFDEAVERFQTWFETNYEKGGKGKPKVRLGPAGDGMRIGVFATEIIKPESLYLSIPINLIIGEDTIFPTQGIGSTLRNLQQNFDRANGAVNRHQATLALYLLHERFVSDEKSFWFPYIALLPTSHDIPEFYSEEQLKLLKGTFIPEKVLHQRDVHRREFVWLKDNVFAKDRTSFPTNVFSYENYLWASGILGTRMIWWNGTPHLVPMLDMINCQQGPNPYRVHSTALSRKGDTADTYAPWEFKAGQQVFENYGQPNPTYYLYHGFVLQPNVHDCATIDLRPFIPGDALSTVDRLRLRRSEYCISPAKYNEAMTVARVVITEEAKRKLIKDAPQGRLNIPDERKALKWLAEAIRDHADRLQDDEGVDKKISMSSEFRVKMALTFKKTQKDLLRSTIIKLRKISRSLRESLAKPEPESKDRQQSSEL